MSTLAVCCADVLQRLDALEEQRTVRLSTLQRAVAELSQQNFALQSQLHGAVLQLHEERERCTRLLHENTVLHAHAIEAAHAHEVTATTCVRKLSCGVSAPSHATRDAVAHLRTLRARGSSFARTAASDAAAPRNDACRARASSAVTLSIRAASRQNGLSHDSSSSNEKKDGKSRNGSGSDSSEVANACAELCRIAGAHVDAADGDGHMHTRQPLTCSCDGQGHTYAHGNSAPCHGAHTATARSLHSAAGARAHDAVDAAAAATTTKADDDVAVAHRVVGTRDVREHVVQSVHASRAKNTAKMEAGNNDGVYKSPRRRYSDSDGVSAWTRPTHAEALVTHSAHVCALSEQVCALQQLLDEQRSMHERAHAAHADSVARGRDELLRELHAAHAHIDHVEAMYERSLRELVNVRHAAAGTERALREDMAALQHTLHETERRAAVAQRQCALRSSSRDADAALTAARQTAAHYHARLRSVRTVAARKHAAMLLCAQQHAAMLRACEERLARACAEARQQREARARDEQRHRLEMSGMRSELDGLQHALRQLEKRLYFARLRDAAEGGEGVCDGATTTMTSFAPHVAGLL